MIKAFVVDNDRLRLVDDLLSNKDKVVWADLFKPTKEEEATIEDWIGVDIPTREEMEEIEISSRLYSENGAYLHDRDAAGAGRRRRSRHVAGHVRACRQPAGHRALSRAACLQDISDARREGRSRLHQRRDHPDRAARGDRRPAGRRAGARQPRGHRHLARHLPSRPRRRPRSATVDFQIILRRHRPQGRPRLQRSRTACLAAAPLRLPRPCRDAEQGRARTCARASRPLSRDVLSLTDHATFLSQKITFLLDATLGMINIEQNAIIKIVSVAAVVFLPPTLVASIYGMNFDVMPELKWHARLSVRASPDGAFGGPAVLVLQAPRLALTRRRRRGWLTDLARSGRSDIVVVQALNRISA